MACHKNCVIAQAYPVFILPNGRTVPHHGHLTSNGCPLISTLNGTHGLQIEGGNEVPVAYKQNDDEEWIPIFAPLKHEDCEYDQHMIFENQDGQALEGIPYRLTDERGAIIEGSITADGKTQVMAGLNGETLGYETARKGEE